MNERTNVCQPMMTPNDDDTERIPLFYYKYLFGGYIISTPELRSFLLFYTLTDFWGAHSIASSVLCVSLLFI
jgi:hypothetical protein